MSRGQIVFYALLALIALVMALGLTTLVVVQYLLVIAGLTAFAVLWVKTWRGVWDRCERKSQKFLVLWFGGLGAITTTLFIWRIGHMALVDVYQSLQAQ